MALVETSLDGHVAVCRLNRPEARNALSPELMEELATAVERFDRDLDQLSQAQGSRSGSIAFSPVAARPMISFWICEVPSYRVVTRASRR